MDGDHHHLHANLPAAAAALSHRPAVFRPAGGAESADRVPVAAGGDGGLLPQGRVAAACDPECDFRRHDALHGDPAHRPGAAVRVSADWPLAAKCRVRALARRGNGFARRVSGHRGCEKYPRRPVDLRGAGLGLPGTHSGKRADGTGLAIPR